MNRKKLVIILIAIAAILCVGIQVCRGAFPYAFADFSGFDMEVVENVEEFYRSPNPAFLSQSQYSSGGLIPIDRFDDTHPAWSPDGERIAFVSDRDGDHDIYVMNADGSALRNLTADPSPVVASLLFLINKAGDGWPAWSPTGAQIAFSSARGNTMMRSIVLDIYLMGADGSNVTPLTDTLDVDGLPDWSPAGDRLVFVSERDEGVNIYIMNLDGSDIVQLTDLECDNDFPSWSPDGKEIVFESDRDGDADIYLMRIDGSRVTQLTSHPAMDGQPTWSPDGRRIAFVSDRDGDNEIFIMDRDGGNVVQITENETVENIPSWSPAGTEIAYQSDQGGGTRIFKVNVDGSNVHQLTDDAAGGPPVEDGVYLLTQGLAQYYRFLWSGDGDIQVAIETLSEAITLDPSLGEAYLSRGMAHLLSCGYLWVHAFGHEIAMLEEGEDCPDFDAAVADIEKGIDLGLAPGVLQGAQNLLSLLR